VILKGRKGADRLRASPMITGSGTRIGDRRQGAEVRLTRILG